jgi:hypothetical protein
MILCNITVIIQTKKKKPINLKKKNDNRNKTCGFIFLGTRHLGLDFFDLLNDPHFCFFVLVATNFYRLEKVQTVNYHKNQCRKEISSLYEDITT